MNNRGIPDLKEDGMKRRNEITQLSLRRRVNHVRVRYNTHEQIGRGSRPRDCGKSPKVAMDRRFAQKNEGQHKQKKHSISKNIRGCSMKANRIKGITVAVVVFVLASAGVKGAFAAPQPKVEVVFCLDTTGSMSGLIEGAKQKIWSIANQIVRGNPAPELSIGLVGYRDYGDAYITRVFELSNDLDAVFDDLMSFRADGGGDTPEHVNRALYDAVHRIRWDKSPDTLKLIFLVGDCPPHTDYHDGYEYRDICRDAVRKDIIINSVQCGDYAETVRYWRDIAKRGEGKYAQIPQEGGMQIIETPYDEELSRLNLLLEDTVVAYGSAEEKAKSAKRKEKVSALAPSVAAERAAYKSVESEIGAYDLIDAVKSGSVDLGSVKDSLLPEEMKGMSKGEKEAFLAQKEQERREIKGNIQRLNEKRERFIADAVEEGNRDSFDEVVAGFIADQAAMKGILY